MRIFPKTYETNIILIAKVDSDTIKKKFPTNLLDEHRNKKSINFQQTKFNRTLKIYACSSKIHLKDARMVKYMQMN